MVVDPLDEQHRQGFEAAFKILSQETDRGAAIVGAAYLDGLLQDCIAKFLKLNGGTVKRFFGNENHTNNPVWGELGSKVNIAAVLGLIRDSEVECLKTISKIRNKFAHNLNSDFDKSRVKEWVRDLQDKIEIECPLWFGSENPSGRMIFIQAVARLAGGFWSKNWFIHKGNI